MSADTAETPPKKRFGIGQISFVLFMLALTVLFVFLGSWQMARLEQKTTMLNDIASRASLAPVRMPPIVEWSETDPAGMSYLPVTVTGRFDHEKTVLVFTSLSSANGVYSGAGYWVVAPLMVGEDGVVFVNRGFVPQDARDDFRDGGGGPEGEITITGIARQSESINQFTPPIDQANSIDYVRNIDRLAEFLDLQDRVVAPVYIDAAATQTGALPQGGETRLTLTNRHYEYAITWYALAIITPLMLLVWLFRGRIRPSRGQS